MKFRLSIVVFLLFISFSNGQSLIDKVNPLMGTNNSFLLSHGNTLPLVARPFGMTYWTPQTAKEGMFKFNFQDTLFYGMRATHIPSPWMGDFASFNLNASVGSIQPSIYQRALPYSHATEKASPASYYIEFQKQQISMELSATERCSHSSFIFPESKKANVFLDVLDKGGYEIQIDPAKRMISGSIRNNNGGVPNNFSGYFVAVFNKSFADYGFIENGKIVSKKTTSKGDTTTVFISFVTKKNEKIEVKVSTSFISTAQAALNLAKEIGNKSFAQTKAESKQIWNDELSKIAIEGGSQEQEKVFYSCYYRSLLFPTKFYEFDAQDQKVYYSPYDGKLHKGVIYTNNGLWDTYRAVFPFFTIMQPKIHQEFCQSLINAYQEGGWLPRWLSPGYREIMIGVHAASLFADAYSKGLTDFDAPKALEGMLKDAYVPNPISDRNKEGLEHYNKKGYVLSTVREGVAKNLEYAYDDYCGYVFAKALGKQQEANDFYKRSFYYKNTFDASTGLMRGKDALGRWKSPFDPYAWGGVFTEGNAWHYLWSVFHDPAGLIDLLGGEEKMILKMDSVFTLPPTSSFDYYGWKIHEIVEMEKGNMGQYAHGNQPIQHFIYLYNYASQPWKAQYWAREIMDKLYNSTENGYCGDEDNGQTSAWYIMSAMGFYPVCPGSTQYILGSPLFKKITMRLPNGKTFVVNATNNNNDNRYIQSATWNGKVFNKTYFTHQELMNGGQLDFVMANSPNKTWAVDKSSKPFSLSEKSFCSPPFLKGNSGLFENSATFSLGTLTENAQIRYTLDGTEPNVDSPIFDTPITITKSCTLKAKTFAKNKEESIVFETSFYNEYIEPSAVIPQNKGLKYQYFEGDWETLPDFDQLTPKKTGVVSQFSIANAEKLDFYAFTYEGYIEIPEEGVYTFYFRSDDGLRFFIGNKMIHEALGRHGGEEYNESVRLKKGYYPIKVYFNEITGGQKLEIYLQSKSLPKSIISENMLGH